MKSMIVTEQLFCYWVFNGENAVIHRNFCGEYVADAEKKVIWMLPNG